MISRYTRDEMGRIWSKETKFEMMKNVEVAVAEVQAEKGMIPKSAAQNIKRKAKFNVKRIEEINRDIGGATAVTYAVPALPK